MAAFVSRALKLLGISMRRGETNLPAENCIRGCDGAFEPVPAGCVSSLLPGRLPCDVQTPLQTHAVWTAVAIQHQHLIAADAMRMHPGMKHTSYQRLQRHSS